VTKPGRVARRRIKPRPVERVGESWELQHNPYTPAGRIEAAQRAGAVAAWKRRRSEKYVYGTSHPNKWGLIAAFFAPFAGALVIWGVVALVR
jgi:hypothetical protein